jgi:hypothetical protein
MNKNQKGFSSVEVFLVFVIAGLIGAGGYYVYEHQQNSGKMARVGETNHTLKTFTDPTNSYTFTYPKGK